MLVAAINKIRQDLDAAATIIRNNLKESTLRTVNITTNLILTRTDNENSVVK